MGQVMTAADAAEKLTEPQFQRVKRWINKTDVDPEYVVEIERLGSKRYLFRSLAWNTEGTAHVLAEPGLAELVEIEVRVPYPCPVWVKKE
jgi:hypothetical protein